MRRDPAPATLEAPPPAPPRRKSYLKANVAVTAAIAIAATATWLTAMSLVEAHGLGASHLGQAADIAHRGGPGTLMIAGDIAALIVVAVLARFAARRFKA